MNNYYPNPYTETRILCKLLIPQEKEKITVEPMAATNFSSFPVKPLILIQHGLHIIPRFYVEIGVLAN